MDGDILELGGPTPTERLSLRPASKAPTRAQPAHRTQPAPPVEPPEAPATATAPATTTASPTLEAPDRPRRGLLYLSVLIIGLVGAGGVGWYLWTTGSRVDLTYAGSPIANPDAVLDQAEQLLATTAEADGADVGDARCFFAAPESGTDPRVVCGPIWLGVSPPDEPWLEMRASYGFAASGDGATGEITDVVGPTTAQTRSFRRPDGLAPSGVGDPTYPPSGRRLEDGQRIADETAVLAAGEAALQAAITEEPEEVAVAADLRCHFVEVPADVALAPHGRPVTGRDLLCGPVRTTGSQADELWIAVSPGYERGPTFGSVQAGQGQAFSLRPRTVPEGAVLVRPDGSGPPTGDDLDRPPLPPEATLVLDRRVELDSDGDGVLVGAFGRIDFDGFARVDRVGRGAESLVAAEGHDLVVAAIEPAERRARPRGVVTVDGTDRALPNWSVGPDGGTLVVSVPRGARQVELLVENDGRPQAISLLDGVKSDGYPVALYRPSPIELGRSLAIRLDMPAGDALIVETLIEAIEWRAQDGDGAWLPNGIGRLVVDVGRFDVDRPCCDVSVDEVTATFELVGPPADDTAGGPGSEQTDDPPGEDEPGPPEAPVDQARFADKRQDPAANPRNDSPFFDVPETLTEVTIVVEISAVIDVDGTQQTVTTTERLELGLPEEP